jgi:FKBP-type peptidyl-prolyl cis-trans isomerase 2
MKTPSAVEDLGCTSPPPGHTGGGCFPDGTPFPSQDTHLTVTIETGDSVTIEYTGRLDDGSVFDTTRESVAERSGIAEEQPDREYAPMTFEIGAEQVIEGLEEALKGSERGETLTVEVPPEKAYGEWDEERVQEFETEEITSMLGGQVPEEGAYLETQNGDLGEVVDVGEDLVRIDFNPHLVGETLEFEVEIVEVTAGQAP